VTFVRDAMAVGGNLNTRPDPGLQDGCLRPLLLERQTGASWPRGPILPGDPMADLISPDVSAYLERLVPPRPSELAEMEVYAKEHKFPIIGPAAGQLCYLVARLTGARTIFELGSGFGYSTAWFARAVRESGGGTVHHVVWDDELSARAREHLSRLGLADLVRFEIGEAVGVLKQQEGPFDLIFNDIDKKGYPESLPVIKEKLRTGGVLIIDNMLWFGRIFDPEDESEDTLGVREFTERITTDRDWAVSLIPIRDGLIVARKIA
jgi:caffeoyl-CoA O-methyltransferase